MKSSDKVFPFVIYHVVNKNFIAGNHACIGTDATKHVGQWPGKPTFGASVELMMHKWGIESFLE